MSKTDVAPSSRNGVERVEPLAAHALNTLIAKEDAPIALAVSGGSDSIALMHIVDIWRRRARRRVIVATVDHGLRPEAAKEAEWVEKQAAALGLSHETLHWRPAADTPIMQAEARNARHGLLYRWAKRHGAHQVLLGHTQDDALETMLIRARAGSRWFGLSGLAAASAATSWPDGLGLQLVRPLLQISRWDLRHWLTARRHGWIDDPSNDQFKYERVRMRSLLAALSSDARNKAIQSLERLRHLRAAEIGALGNFIARDVQCRSDGAIDVSTSAMRSLRPDRRSRMINWLSLCASGSAAAPKNAACDRLGQLVEKLDVGGQTLGDAWCAWDSQDICFYRRPEGEARTQGAPQTQPVSITPGCSVVWDGRFSVSISKDCPAGRLVSFDQAVQRNDEIEGVDELRRLGDARARRSLPILLTEDGTARAPSPRANTSFRISALTSKRLAALADERSATDIVLHT